VDVFGIGAAPLSPGVGSLIWQADELGSLRGRSDSFSLMHRHAVLYRSHGSTECFLLWWVRLHCWRVTDG
jgi:hypothetical protein